MERRVFRFCLLAIYAALSACQATGQGEPTALPPPGSYNRLGTSMMRRGAPIRPSPPLTLSPSVSRHQKSLPLTPGIRRLVPQDYPTVQAAIDSSSDGDTVLMSEGIYFENIRYRGKAITVASLYLIDGDTTHIERTIIDGSKSTIPDSGSVVYFIHGEDTTSVLCGLTIRSGTGTVILFDGIRARGGGGVYGDSGGAKLVHNFITGNRAIGPVAYGGGVAFEGFGASIPFVILEGNRITDNLARGDSAGGQAFSGGADIWNTSTRVAGNLFERDSAIAAGFVGGGALSFYSGFVFYPPVEADIRGNIFRANIGIGTSVWAPGVLVWGTGETWIEGNLFQDNVSTATVWAEGGGLMIDDGDPNEMAIIGLGVKRVIGNRFVNNRVHGTNAMGPGLELGHTIAILRGNEIFDNTASATGWCAGGGMSLYRSSFRLENNLIARNTASIGGGIAVLERPQAGNEQVLVNNTILENHAQGAGGLGYVNLPPVACWNTILWSNTPDQMLSGSGLSISYSDIQGGWPGEGNIDADPRFADITYRLSDSSSCIGHGMDSIQVGGTWYHAPGTDFSGSVRPNPPGSRPDIGAWENPLAVDVYSSPLAITPLLCDFQNVHCGSVSDTVSLIVQNRGPTARNIQSVSFGRSEFHLAPMPALPMVLAPYSIASLSVQFSPTLVGTVVRDTLIVGTSDTMAPRIAVPLTGRGSGEVQYAQGGVLYALSASSGTLQLNELDKSKGHAALNAQFSPHPPAGLCALTVRRQDNMIYGAFPSGSGTYLYRLSSAYGDFEFAGTIPLATITSMAFSGGDTLYLSGANGRLYRIKGIVGDTVLVGMTGVPFTGLAFDPATGTLWGSLHDSVFTISTATAAATFVGKGYPGVGSSSITFSPFGTLYGLYDNALVVVNRATGDVTTIGPSGLAGRQLIAMRSDPSAADLAASTELPRETKLYQNYPNPFNPTSNIRYLISDIGYVKLSLFDLLGREVATLVNERKTPGSYEVIFDGAGLASGVYVYRISSGTHVESRKMILMK